MTIDQAVPPGQVAKASYLRARRPRPAQM